MPAFQTPIDEADGVLCGPFREPRQMLAAQERDGHATIHDDATAQKLGFRGGAIEGPTHFSQFAPLGYALWGERWLSAGCLSAHYRNAAFEGDAVQACLRKPASPDDQAEIWMLRADGTEILRGSASVGSEVPPSALETRLAELKPCADPVILADVAVGMTSPRTPVHMDPDQHMGSLYPISLTQKLGKITEPSPWYGGVASPWGRAIVPIEMVSVLMYYDAALSAFPMRGPAVGLFADQEIRLLDGPVFVGEPYEIQREVIFIGGSRRTESLWTRSTLFAPGSNHKIAEMLLNLALMKESYAPYELERAALYP